MSRRSSRPPRVLITDDEGDVRGMLSILLQAEGMFPLEAEDGPAALNLVRQGAADVMLLDLAMPGMDGFEVLRESRKLNPRIPTILLTGCATVESAIRAGQQGACGFLTKPFKNDEVVFTVLMAIENRWFKQENLCLCAPSNGRTLREAMGNSDHVRRVIAEVERVAPTDFTVIISGETGVGKELVSRSIHELSRRSGGPFVPVDCGSIPPTLIESQLFGHEKGAFTGADRARPGSFETASGGTLFLDEIGNLPLPMQARLLRALQERQIFRVGGTTPIRLDVRVVAATNEDLPGMVEAGTFRRDLFYRLNEFSITLPPLRARQEDILFLAKRFLEWTCAELRKTCELSKETQAVLLGSPWPGNVRELRNVIRRAVLLAETQINPEHLSLADTSPAASAVRTEAVHENGPELSLKEIVRGTIVRAEREVLLRVLKQTGGNMAQAARVLRIDYKTIRTKAKEYQLSPFN